MKTLAGSVSSVSVLFLCVIPAVSAPSWYEGGVDGANLCFARDYSDAHLAAHPKQDTRALQLRVKGATVRLTIAGRQSDRVEANASCDWSARSGRDINGRVIVQGHAGGPGYDCIVTGDPASAAEEGYLLIVPSVSDRNVLLYVQDEIGVHSGSSTRLVRRRMGPEDRLFRLEVAPRETCGMTR